MQLLDYLPLQNLLADNDLQGLASELPQLLDRGLDIRRYGDIPRWRESLDALPEIAVTEKHIDKSTVTVDTAPAIDPAIAARLEAALRGLHPWRKGPFDIFGISIDTEWRSDLKWDRLSGSIDSLEDKVVLDVGCGSGYHCWRMAGAGARLVLGIDPTPLFIMQYWALQKYLQDPRAWVVPMRMEVLPEKLQAFDTAFSMGILYHRRSPFDHLLELHGALKAGGQLVLETLVIDGQQGEVLVPQGRYGKMGNVWFIPSVPTLCGWLEKMKFRDVKVVDVSVTSSEEQRATDWMQFQSLADFLDPQDSSKTVEGYPAPRRAVLTAYA